MPPLYEGSLLYMPTSPPGLSMTEATRLLQVQDKVLRQFPEVERVFGTVGRGTSATDNSPMGMVNTTITLKPREQWRPGMTLEALQAEMDAALQFPGLPNVWTQPIRNRLDMLSTGIKTPVGIKIFGPDLTVIQRLGQEIERALERVDGTRSVYAERVTQGYFTDIPIDRAAIARYGLTIAGRPGRHPVGARRRKHHAHDRGAGAVPGQRALRSATSGKAFRDLERVLVKAPTGAQVPLGQLAEITLTTGPAMIRDENAQLAGYVYIDTATRDIGGYVDRAREADRVQRAAAARLHAAVDGAVRVPGARRERLRILIPIVLFVIFMLLYMTFHSVSEALIVMLSVVYAMTGGVILQWLLGYNFSVAVWVGYIALYGVAVQTGVVMVVYLHEALDGRLRRGGELTEQDIWEATVAGRCCGCGRS